MADKQQREIKGFLSEENRSQIISTLKDGGVVTDGLSDEELLSKLQTDYSAIKKIRMTLSLLQKKKTVWQNV